MNNEKVLVIHIMGKEFNINCPDEEREEILQAAEFLNKKSKTLKMRERSLIQTVLSSRLHWESPMSY